MKLSDAIRLGAMLRPQGYAALYADGKTCALGAAAQAVGIQIGENHSALAYVQLRERWPFLADRTSSPQGTRYSHVMSIIEDLNDQHGWTREQIADWIETLESAEQPAHPEATNVDAVASSDDHGMLVHASK